MLKIEEDINWPFAIPNCYGLTIHHGAQRRNALLAIQKELARHEDVLRLCYRKVTRGGFLIGLPHKERPRWIAAIKRVEQVAHSRGGPHIATLHFWQAQFSPAHHVDDFPDSGV